MTARLEVLVAEQLERIHQWERLGELSLIAHGVPIRVSRRDRTIVVTDVALEREIEVPWSLTAIGTAEMVDDAVYRQWLEPRG